MSQEGTLLAFLGFPEKVNFNLASACVGLAYPAIALLQLFPDLDGHTLLLFVLSAALGIPSVKGLWFFLMAAVSHKPWLACMDDGGKH